MSEVNSLQCELPPSRQEIIDRGSVPFSAVAQFLFCYFIDASFCKQYMLIVIRFHSMRQLTV